MLFRWATIGAGVLTIAASGLSQQPQLNSQIPEDAFSTRPLVVWSDLKTPPPTPLPLKDSPVPKSDEHPAATFTGWIVKDGAEYLLAAANNATYRIELASGIEPYERQKVSIVGVLDPRDGRIQVLKIELL